MSKIILLVIFCISLIESKILVLSPKRLADLFRDPVDHKPSMMGIEYPGVINSSYGNFGFIPYGHSMVSKSFYL